VNTGIENFFARPGTLIFGKFVTVASLFMELDLVNARTPYHGKMTYNDSLKSTEG